MSKKATFHKPRTSYYNIKTNVQNHAQITHCGGVGTGGAVKICNNMLLAISMIGTSEAMNLGIR